MAIAFDSSAIGSYSTTTWSHTCASSGSDVILLVAVWQGGTGISPTAKYNGVSMLNVTGEYYGGFYAGFYIFSLLNPTAGTNTVTITCSYSYYKGTSVSYTGVDASLTTYGSFASNTGYGLGASAININNTVSYSGTWCVNFGMFNNPSYQVTSSRTVRQNTFILDSNDSTWSSCIEDSNGSTLSTGTLTTSFSTGGVTGNIGGIVILLIPFGTITYAPTVTTSTLSVISTTEIDGGGNVTSDGGASVTARGICWSTTSGSENSSVNYTSDGTGTGTYTSIATGLNSRTKYYFKAYATNKNGTSYGSELSATTISDVNGSFLPFFM